MSKVHLLKRYLSGNYFLNGTSIAALQRAQFSDNKKNSSSSSSSSSSSDDEKHQQRLIEKKKSENALEKLNKLLLTMTEDKTVSSKSKLDLAQPKDKRRKVSKDQDSKPKKPTTPEAEMVNAAKDVAESIGGDVKQTQSELLMKLLNVSHGTETTATNLTDLVKGMKVDQEESKSQQVKQILDMKTSETELRLRKSKTDSRPQPRSDIVVEKIDLFGSQPLGIFTAQQEYSTGVENKTWNALYQKDLKLAVTHPPSNYYQQMILWTEQGKVWKFPIDNEQGLEEERKVYFTEHVFLEKHIEPWCPSKGPVRHFMELVCVGLSKNPYLTVEAKKEHLMWFKNYFDEKKQLLRETGAIQDSDKSSVSQQQIE